MRATEIIIFFSDGDGADGVRQLAFVTPATAKRAQNVITSLLVYYAETLRHVDSSAKCNWIVNLS